MSIERTVLAFTGAVICLSVVLAWMFSPRWMLLTLFVGFNLFQSAFTGLSTGFAAAQVRPKAQWRRSDWRSGMNPAFDSPCLQGYFFADDALQIIAKGQAQSYCGRPQVILQRSPIYCIARWSWSRLSTLSATGQKPDRTVTFSSR
ncbi:MAG: DUF2892 domain-containing protein [Halioglobus sp.]|nr:DUF2892 domain-containing protein [Halioglobus sp.]